MFVSRSNCKSKLPSYKSIFGSLDVQLFMADTKVMCLKGLYQDRVCTSIEFVHIISSWSLKLFDVYWLSCNTFIIYPFHIDLTVDASFAVMWDMVLLRWICCDVFQLGNPATVQKFTKMAKMADFNFTFAIMGYKKWKLQCGLGYARQLV